MRCQSLRKVGRKSVVVLGETSRTSCYETEMRLIFADQRFQRKNRLVRGGAQSTAGQKVEGKKRVWAREIKGGHLGFYFQGQSSLEMFPRSMASSNTSGVVLCFTSSAPRRVQCVRQVLQRLDSLVIHVVGGFMLYVQFLWSTSAVTMGKRAPSTTLTCISRSSSPSELWNDTPEISETITPCKRRLISPCSGTIDRTIQPQGHFGRCCITTRWICSEGHLHEDIVAI